MEPCSTVAVVVGGGIAGASCAAELSELLRGDDALNLRVVLVSPSPVVRVASLGTLYSDEVTVAGKSAQDWAANAGVTIVSGYATGITGQSITLDRSEAKTLAFDVCCIATGARPKIPEPLATVDPPLFQGRTGCSLDARVQRRILTLRDTDSVALLSDSVAHAQCVAIVGNGGIALELAHEITGCNVVWIIRDKHIGNAFFDRRGGDALFQFLLRSCEGIGLQDIGEKQVTSQTLLGGSRSNTAIAKDMAIGHDVPGPGVGPNWTGMGGNRSLLHATDGRAVRPREEDRPRHRLQIERGCQVAKLTWTNTGNTSDAESSMPILLTLTNGSTVSCDYVVCATGVEPNVGWIGPESGVTVDSASQGEGQGVDDDAGLVAGGIVVHAGSMQSCSRSDIFAAGDCATIVGAEGAAFGAESSPDANWFQMRLWTQAARCGQAAGACMAAWLRGARNESLAEAAGVSQCELFAHTTRFFGQRVVLLGRYNAQGLGPGFKVLESGGDDDDASFVRVVLENGRVRGAILIGDTDLAETYENLILDRLDVSGLGSELVDPSVDLADYFD